MKALTLSLNNAHIKENKKYLLQKNTIKNVFF